MKVKELMEKLAKVDPEAHVIKTSDNFEQENALVAASTISVSRATIREKTCVDGFDSTVYTKKVYDPKLSGEIVTVRIH